MATVAPNAYLIGAQKAGTTFLAARLDQSPDICVSDPKEPQYLTSQYHRGADWYASCFSAPNAPVLLDASTTYSFLRPCRFLDVLNAPGLLAPVPERMAALNPDAHLIYVLRDPVARAVSVYKHQQRYKAAPAGEIYLPDVLDADPMIELVGRYADQIERYLEVFDIDRFLFIDFADLISKPDAVVARAANFLGVSPPELLPATDEDSSRHKAHQVTRLGQLRRQLQTYVPGLEHGLRRILPQTIQKRFIEPLLKRDISLTLTGYGEAAERFSEDRRRVKELTGITI